MPISLPTSSYLADVTLRADVSGTPFGGAPSWTDYSSSLLTAGDGSPIQITRLRQDENAEVSPSSMSFTLDNTTGAFTPGHASAPAGWDVGARVNIRLGVSGTTYDRFDGYIDSIEPSYPGQDWSLVRVSATDITARLALGQPLRSMLEQEMLLDSPTFLYALQEPSEAVSVGSMVNPTTMPVLTAVNSKYGGSTFSLGNETTLMDGATSANFDSPNAGTNTNGPLTVLRSRGADAMPAMPPASGGFTTEIWFRIPVAPTLLTTLAGFFSDDARHSAAWYVEAPGTVRFFMSSNGGPTYTSSPLSGNVCDGRWHHAFSTVSGDYQTVSLVLDGNDLGVGAVSAIPPVQLSNIFVGGQILPNGANAFGAQGNIAYFAMYPGVQSAARAATKYEAGVGALIERSDLRFARLASYAGLATSGLPVGIAMMGGQNIGGSGITEALNKVARTEGSVAYATGAGALTFQSRNARYDAVTGLALTGSDLNPETTTRRDRQGMANEITVQRDGGAQQRFVDATSQTAHGRFDGGSFTVAPSTDYDALQNAAWQVGTRKNPRTRLPGFTVNLIALDSAALVEQILAADISTLATVTALPNQAPASSMSVFVEGWTETIGAREWAISFFSGPNLPRVGKVTAGPDPDALLDGSMLVGF